MSGMRRKKKKRKEEKQKEERRKSSSASLFPPHADAAPASTRRKTMHGQRHRQKSKMMKPRRKQRLKKEGLAEPMPKDGMKKRKRLEPLKNEPTRSTHFEAQDDSLGLRNSFLEKLRGLSPQRLKLLPQSRDVPSIRPHVRRDGSLHLSASASQNGSNIPQ